MKDGAIRYDRLLVFTAALLVAFAVDARGQRQRPGGRGSRWGTPEAMKTGAEAPDFELPQLVYETDDKGNEVARITDEKTRLSSYEGNKVVCVFMSSYT